MANVLVEETSLEDIADAIRSKNGLTTKYKPAEMADAISAISGGGISPTGTKQINITQNGTVTEDVTQYANAQVNVNVPSVSPAGTKQVSITQNGTTTEDVTNYASAEIAVNVLNSYSASDEGKVVSNGALVGQTSRQVTANGTYDTTLNSSVEVNVPQGITPTGTKNITTNGDHDVTNFATAHVDVPTGITPSGSQEFTQNGTYNVTSLAEAVVNVASGGGATKVEGEFTITSVASQNFPTITHNLNTQKIAVLVYPVGNHVGGGQYRTFYLAYVNPIAWLSGTSWNLDFSPYSTKLTEPVQVNFPNDAIWAGIVQVSPATAGTAWDSAGANLCAFKSNEVVLTDNTFKYNGSSYRANWDEGTYHYVIAKIGD